MAGTWRVNITLGFMAFLFTYFSSSVNNTWQTSLFRGLIGFLVFFVSGYIFRFILELIGAKKTMDANEGNDHEVEIPSATSLEENYEVEESTDESSFQTIPLQSLHIHENE